MKKLNLHNFLSTLGASQLSEIIGHDRLKILSNMMKKNITENVMVDLIFSTYGTQILSNKKIRECIFLSLPKDYLSFILHGNSDKSHEITKQDYLKLIKMNWNKDFKAVNRLIEVFNLSDEYLPPRAENKPTVVEVRPKNSLFDYQKRIKDNFVKQIRDGQKRMIINMPTGSGKTRTTVSGFFEFMQAIKSKNKLIVWIAHSEELCEQAFETIFNLWSEKGDSKLMVYRMWDIHKPKLKQNTGGIIITSYQTLNAMRTATHNEPFERLAEIKRRCHTIVVDEAHKTTAETYLASINFISDIDETNIIGLTATPGKGLQDESNKELAEFYNNNLVTITDDNNQVLHDEKVFNYLQKKGYLAEMKQDIVETEFTHSLTVQEINSITKNLEIPSSLLTKISSDEKRNFLILKKIIEYDQKENSSIIVFACSLDHVSLLNQMCKLEGLKVGSLGKENSRYDREMYVKKFRNRELKILINHSILTTGFDAPNTNTVIITRPTLSLNLYNQMIGRAARGPEVKGNKISFKVDLQDNISGLPNEKLAFTFYRPWFKNIS